MDELSNTVSQSGAVSVWQVAVAASPLPDAIGADLSDEERAQAARFGRPRDRERYVATHAALRSILAAGLDCLPRQVRYVYGPQGKPRLHAELEGSGLTFNLAHSGDLALIATAARREVGVDIEQYRPLPEAERIVEQYFSPAEHRSLASLPAADRREAFFQIWTCKEAFLKATGLGLAEPLAGFSVPLPNRGAVDPVPVEAATDRVWGLQTLAVARGYAAAVVAEGLDWKTQLRHYRFEA